MSGKWSQRCNAMRAATVLAMAFMVAAEPICLSAEGPEVIGWNNVLKLTPGEEIELEFEGRKVSGAVESVSPESVSITGRDTGLLTIPQPKVKKVREKRRLSKLGAAMIAGGASLIAAKSVIDTGRDLHDLNQGRFPKERSAALNIAGFGTIAAGVYVLLFKGGKTIYEHDAK